MDYKQAYEKLEAYGQTQLLHYYDTLDRGQQMALLAQIEETDFAQIACLANHKHELKRGVITPIASMQIDEIRERETEFENTGIEAIQRGQVGAVLLAGGMGTRLGSNDPKGMYNVGITRRLYIFECLIRNLLDVVKKVDAWVPLFVMTSDKNHDKTVSFFEQMDYFGYNKEEIYFFKQDMAPATDYNGKVYLEQKGKISTSPNGNGGWFVSMKKAGLQKVLHEKGIQWLNVFAVDNVLQRIADPVFVGAVIRSGVEAGSKVVRKAEPREKMGVMCLEDGRPSIVEYYELSDAMAEERDEKGDYAYNFGVILNYLFSVPALERILSKEMPLHIVEKKIPYLDADGNKISPEKPNGYKYEQLVLDMIHQLDSCLPFEVVREKEFAPIKNKTGVDSVDTARELLKQNQVEL